MKAWPSFLQAYDIKKEDAHHCRLMPELSIIESGGNRSMLVIYRQPWSLFVLDVGRVHEHAWVPRFQADAFHTFHVVQPDNWKVFRITELRFDAARGCLVMLTGASRTPIEAALFMGFFIGRTPLRCCMSLGRFHAAGW